MCWLDGGTLSQCTRVRNRRNLHFKHLIILYVNYTSTKLKLGGKKAGGKLPTHILVAIFYTTIYCRYLFLPFTKSNWQPRLLNFLLICYF